MQAPWDQGVNASPLTGNKWIDGVSHFIKIKKIIAKLITGKLLPDPTGN